MNARDSGILAKGLSIAYFDTAIQLKPDYVEACGNSGLAYFRKGDYDHAIADYDKAIQIEPDYGYPHYGRGNAYWGKGDAAKALDDFRAAVRLNGGNAPAFPATNCIKAHGSSKPATLAAARKWKREATGKCEGPKAHAEVQPDVVELVRRLRRRRPTGGQMSCGRSRQNWRRRATSTSAAVPIIRSPSHR